MKIYLYIHKYKEIVTFPHFTLVYTEIILIKTTTLTTTKTATMTRNMA